MGSTHTMCEVALPKNIELESNQSSSSNYKE